MMLLDSLQDTGWGVELGFRSGGGWCPNNNNLPPTPHSVAPVMDHNGLNGRHCQQMFFWGK